MLYRSFKSTYWRIVTIAKKPLLKSAKKPETPREPKKPEAPTPVEAPRAQHRYECWNCAAITMTDVGPLAKCPACEVPSR